MTATGRGVSDGTPLTSDVSDVPSPTPGAGGGTGGTATLLSASGGVVGLLSYAVTLVMAHLLPAPGYTAFAAAVAVVGTAGVASAALIPFPLAHVVRALPPHAPERRAATAFAVGVSVLVGLVAAVVLGLVVGPVADVPTALAAAVSGLALFAIAPVWGFLQGESRFVRYATLTVGEVAVRLVASVVAVVVGAGAWGAVGGFAVGALAVLAVSAGPRTGPFAGVRVAEVRAALADRARWAETGGVAATQAVLSALAAADAVVAALVLLDATAGAGYQAVATLAKAPVYVAVGTALVSFPVLRVAAGIDRDLRLREALASFVRLVVPAAAVVATVPTAVVGLVLPERYLPSVALLPTLALLGVGLGTTTVLATLLLAVRARRALTAALVAAVVALGAGLAAGASGILAGLPGVPDDPAGPLAAGAAAGALVGALAVALLGAAHRPRAVAPEPSLRRSAVVGAAYAVAVVVVLAAARALSPAVWVAAVVVLGLGLVGLPVLAGRVSPAPTEGAPDRGRGALHVLHLAFEDPAMPGSGGGALRTAEIDRRLAAAGHHVTVLTGRYPGAVDRVERHGRGSVAWVHPGVGRGRTRLTRLLAYMAAAFVAARRAGRRHAGDTATAPGPVDLVVEDFFAPISSMAIPAWTRRPVVGVVQWLNAKEKAAQYHVPVHWVERAAVRTHRRIVAVSHGVGAATKALSPDAEVAVIGNGVDPVAFSVPPAPVRERRDVVFVGRLEIAQKGLDLLLDAWALAADRVEGDLLLAGTGPDEAALRDRARERGIADRVRFLGWVAGRDKAELVSRARVAAVPSRFETFGIVAAEALAVGTPVVAFDIDCLREVVPADGGVLVPGLDAADYAEALVALVDDEPRRAVTARRGPDLARIHDWDALAATQDAFYRRVAAEGRAPWEAPRVPAGRS